MRLKDGWRILWRTADSVQVGVDAHGAVVIEGLSADERDFLFALDGAGVSLATSTGQSIRHRTREAAVRIRELLTTLGALETEPSGPGKPSSRPRDSVAVPRADLRIAHRLGHRSTALEGRTRARVHLSGLDPLGAQIALGLAASGVGTIQLNDRRAVTHADHPPYRDADTGRVRHDVLADLLRRDYRDLRIDCVEPDELDPHRVDLAIVTDSWVSQLAFPGRLTAGDVPHLAVVIGELDTEVGPLVLPGTTACLRCVALTRTDADECWPAIATQVGTFPELELDHATRLRAAGLAVTAVLAHLDQRPGGLLDRPAQAIPALSRAQRETLSIRVGPRGVLPRVARWHPHPACGCAQPLHRTSRHDRADTDEARRRIQLRGASPAA